jgi:hypothetical protein
MLSNVSGSKQYRLHNAAILAMTIGKHRARISSMRCHSMNPSLRAIPPLHFSVSTTASLP